MAYFSDSISVAIQLILKFDPKVYEIVWTSLKISLIATALSGLLGVFLGIWAGTKEFIGKSLVRHTLNTLMAMPTVMIGLIFYGLLSQTHWGNSAYSIRKMRLSWAKPALFCPS
jgi:tungstate transport system permease protein